MNTKNNLRKLVYNRIEELSQNDKDSFSSLICQRLQGVDCFNDAKVVLSYLATDKEVNVDKFNAYLKSKGIKVVYPKVKGDIMEAYYPLDDNYVIGQFGIREPDINNSEIVDGRSIDTVIVPCVGFDDKKNRLGHGKGYYDKYLQDLSVFKVLVGFEAQRLSEVITDKYDITMDICVSEQEIYE